MAGCGKGLRLKLYLALSLFLLELRECLIILAWQKGEEEHILSIKKYGMTPALIGSFWI